MPVSAAPIWRRLLGATAVALALQATAARADSLVDALVAAYDNNPQLLAERAQLRATDESVPKALSGWRPTVTVSGNAGKTRYTTESFGGNPFAPGPTYLQTYQYGLTATQPLYQGGRTTARTRAALNDVAAERARLVSIEQSVLLAAVTDYLNVVEAQSTLDLTISNQHVFEKQREATGDRFAVGEVTRTDVAQADAAVAQAVAQRQQADAQLQVDRAAYQRDIGTMPGFLLAPTGTIGLPASKDEATAAASTDNPDVQTAQYSRASAEDNVKVVRSQLLPNLSLQASVARANDTQFERLRYNDESVTAQLNVPLYEAGSVYSDTRAAKQTVGVRAGQLEQARRQAIEAASSAWEQLKEASANVASFQTQIKANELALQGVQQESAVGERTVLDVLNAEQALFQSRVSLVQAQHDEMLAKYTLAAAVGTLTARSLGLPVQYYDPAAHLAAVRHKWIGLDAGQ
jgi:outer membrane protein